MAGHVKRNETEHMRLKQGFTTCHIEHRKGYPEVSGLAAWSKNCKWYSSLPLCAVVSLFCEQSSEFCRHNPLCCFSMSVYSCKRIFCYQLSPETFGYTLVFQIFYKEERSICSPVSIMIRLWDVRPGFHSRQNLGFFLLTTASGPALLSTQPPIQWVPGDLSQGIKLLGSEVYHSPPSSVEIKNAWSCTSNFPVRLHGIVTS
jgi:hypothetical protein